MKRRIFAGMTAIFVLAGAARAAEPVRISAWAQEEVAAARACGVLTADFADYTAPITRAEFARLAVDCVAAAKQTTVYALAEQYALLPPADPASEPAPIDPTTDAATDIVTLPTDAPTGANPPMPAPVLPPNPPLPMHAARTPFTDTDDLYVVLAAALGVVQGETDGRFRPQDGIARCEAAAMLTRCMAALGAPDANAAPAVFSDAWDMPRWAVPSIKFVSGRVTAEGRALMGGAGGAFAPRGAYTTEEAVASVLRGYLSLGVGDAQPDWRAAPGYDTVQLAFTAGGDCTFGRGADFAYRGSFDEMYDQKSAAYFFENVRDFRDDDLTMVNFEGTLTTATRAARKQFVFRGRQEYAEILPAGSIDVVTIANNHSRDYLQQGYEDTVRSLSPYVAVSGYDRLPIVTVKGVRVGFASNVGWAFDSAQKAFIQNAVQTLRDAGAELVIFNFHWGTERQYRSNATQRAIAHYAVDCGADLVIGHHPHVVQEVETYKGRQIAYSLGNLCFGGNQNPSDKNCMLFRQNFTVNLDTRAATSAAYRAIPYKVSSVPGRNDYRPTPA